LSFLVFGCKPAVKPPAPPQTRSQTPSITSQPADPELITANNRGVGLMGKFQYEDARAIFQHLADQQPDWLDVKVNLAIATLNRQREGDEDAALAMLDDVLRRDPDHLRAHYCTGLLKLYLQSPQQALPHFTFVAEKDDKDAHAAYYVGQCLAQMRRYDEAAKWYEKAIANDGYLRSGYFALSQAYRALNRNEDAAKTLDSFQALERNPRARLVAFRYKSMGPKSEAAVVDIAGEQRPKSPAPRPDGPIFADPVPLLTDGDQYKWVVRRDDRPVSISACDINNDGLIDVFIANVLDESGGARNAVCINKGEGKFALDPEHVLAMAPDVNAALWGDYDNDGLTDVYLCRRGPNMLWRQTEKNVWTDVTALTQTANGEFDAVDGAIFDADHDGDLDIFCVNFDGPNELLNNNLDGTFKPIAAERGIAGSGKGSIQVLPVDLDNDRDLDIVVLNKQPPHDVWVNNRGWQYRAFENAAFRNTQISSITTEYPEAAASSVLITHASAGEPQIWELPSFSVHSIWNGPVAYSLPAASPNGSYRTRLAAIDIDGNGESELVWGGAVCNISPANQDNPEKTQIGVAAFAGDCALALLDHSNGYSSITMTDAGPLLWRPGSGRYPFATVSFTGREVTSENRQVRSNASGIGTHFAARIDSMWVMGNTLKNSSGPGQSLQPVAIGLGGHQHIDFLSIDWSDGVFQSEVDLKAGEHHTIVETQRQLSSCPVIFAWNGTKYEFITDALGVGGIGYMVAPGEYAPPRPWENIAIPSIQLRPKNDRYIIKLTEPMEEACYLDAAKLVAYDLPRGWKMTLDERMNIAGPEPSGEPVFYREEILPVSAINDRDEDVVQTIIAADLKAAPAGELDHRFIGRLATEHVLTLKFEKPITMADNETTRGGKPLLVIDGWIEYPYSQTMFAAWQAGADYRAPSIEARSEEGIWQTVLEQFGYPAGMPRQMSVPLDNLPPHTTHLRITTNQEIYFDRIAIAFGEALPPGAKRHELKLDHAKLIQSGFAQRTNGDQRQPLYDYDRRVPYWDTRYQRGFYTTLGPMTELVRDHDEALAIFGPGEEVHMEFFANLPPVAFTLGASSESAEGGGRWTRMFILQLRGWCKDMDLFTKDGETIDPLPVSRHLSADELRRRDELHSRFNTRYESGR
jgi:tetratricopeptide (TPR) repeat protein